MQCFVARLVSPWLINLDMLFGYCFIMCVERVCVLHLICTHITRLLADTLLTENRDVAFTTKYNVLPCITAIALHLCARWSSYCNTNMHMYQKMIMFKRDCSIQIWFATPNHKLSHKQRTCPTLSTPTRQASSLTNLIICTISANVLLPNTCVEGMLAL